jgi:penicillin-binding protein 1A
MPPLKRLLRWIVVTCLVLFLIGAAALATVYVSVSSHLPDISSLRHVEMQEPLFVYSRDGKLMAVFGETWRYPVTIQQVPKLQQQAFLAIEDSRFYKHHGVDYKGVARAVWLLATTDDKRVPGGSTITQQVARQFFLSSEYSYTRKLAEMLLAMKMERMLSKDQILELYLNKSFFGNRAYGIAAAADYYYGKPLGQLSLDEMASLAAIPKFPSSGNPISNPERAQQRRDYVLQRMRELGWISPAQAAAAQAVPMHARPHEPPIEVRAPYVAEMVRQEMIARYGGDALSKGYRVTTTIDPVLQAAAEIAVSDGLLTYDHRHGWRKPERHLDLAADQSPAAAARLLRGIATEAGLRPALVLGPTPGNGLSVVLADGSVLELPATAARWTGKPAGQLAVRGDMVRVLQDGKTGAWQLDQLPRAQAALVSLNAQTGAIRALIGGFSFSGNEFNRATQARRQPGSSFKPFLYAAAFERGYSPASVVLDAPVVFRDRRGKVWSPQNDTGDFAGPMRLREALVQSRNLVSVRLLDAIGVPYVRGFLPRFGFSEDEIPPNLSMSLGTASLRPIEVARGYTAFVNGGWLITPWLVESVVDRDGKTVYQAQPALACASCTFAAPTVAGAGAAAIPASGMVDGFNLGDAATPAATPATPPPATNATTPASTPAQPLAGPQAPRAIDPRVAYELNSMMRDVVLRGTATAARVLNRADIGGKTGSTNNHRDAWFSGFGANLVTTVWVGRDDFQSLGYREYGGKAALPIWIDYMRVALEGRPVAALVPPDGMVKVTVSADGRLLPAGTPGITEYIRAEDLAQLQVQSQAAPTEQEQEPQAFDIF